MEHDVQGLVAQGEWRRAADLAREQQDLATAEALYVRLLDYGSAGRAAQEAGALARALGHYVQAGDGAGIEAVVALAISGLSDDLLAMAQICAQASRFAAAGHLYAACGRLVDAADAYTKGLAFSAAGLIYQRLGRWREAGVAFSAQVRVSPDDVEAALGLATTFQALGQHREAVSAARPVLRSLQAVGGARRAQELSFGERLAFSLGALGMQPLWSSLAPLFPGLPAEPTPGHYVQMAERHGLGGEGLERYHVHRPWVGPFAEAYLARDTATNRTALIQVLHGSHAARAAYIGLLQRLSDPPLSGVAALLDADQGGRYVVLEAPQGVTLAEQTRVRPLGSPEIMELGRQLTRVLGQVHQRGVVHGALDPWSLVVGELLALTVWGFGAQASRLDETVAGGDDAERLLYLAPEVAMGQPPDVRADVYGVGAVLWRLLTGAVPRPGRLDSGGPVDGRLLSTLGALVQADPALRPSSMEEVAVLLRGLGAFAAPVPVHGAPPQVTPALGQRYEVLASGEGEPALLWDRWLERKVWRWAWLGRPPGGWTERLAAVAGCPDGVAQRLWRVDPEARTVDCEVLVGRAATAAEIAAAFAEVLQAQVACAERLQGVGQGLVRPVAEDFWWCEGRLRWSLLRQLAAWGAAEEVVGAEAIALGLGELVEGAERA